MKTKQTKKPPNPNQPHSKGKEANISVSKNRTILYGFVYEGQNPWGF